MVHVIVTGSAPRRGQAPLSLEQANAFERIMSLGTREGIPNPMQTITHGCANGFDALAGKFAFDFHIKCHEFPADWAKHKRGAGPIRNRQMVRETIKRYGVDNVLVLAFTNDCDLVDSRGTFNCTNEARTRGLYVHHYNINRNGSWSPKTLAPAKDL